MASRPATLLVVVAVLLPMMHNSAFEANAHRLAMTARAYPAADRGNGTVTTPTAIIWASLQHRPLHLPRLRPRATCPVSPTKQISALYTVGKTTEWPFGGWVLGTGPVYPQVPGPTSIMEFMYPPPHWSIFYKSVWSGQKVPWIVDPSVRDQSPILIRGHQLDGPHELRFSMLDRDTLHPAPELRLIADAASPFHFSSFTRIRSPGCYAYQVDAPDFSIVIVFKAEVCHIRGHRRQERNLGPGC